MITIKEIAKIAGVSRGTVDRVLNNRGTVKQETSERVQSIAKALNYRPNLAGKTLAVRKKNLKFGYILFSDTASNPFFADVARGIKSRAKELLDYGVAVEIRYAKIDNPSLQVQLIDELVGNGIDGLAITPISHPDVASKILQLTQSGVPVVTANSDISGSGRLAYVGSDYYKSGVTAAGLINLTTGGSANVGIIIGNPLIECHTERIAGFRNQVSSHYPGIHIMGQTTNNDDDLESFAVTQRLLEETPEIDALYLAAAGVSGACKAVKCAEPRRKIHIVSCDLIPATLALLNEGSVAATITQQPFLQGTKPLDILLAYIGMGIPPESERFYTKIEIKIRENAC